MARGEWAAEARGPVLVRDVGLPTRAPRFSETEPLRSVLLRPAPTQRPQRGRRVAGAEKISKDLVATRMKVQSENCGGKKKWSREISTQALPLVIPPPVTHKRTSGPGVENPGR